MPTDITLLREDEVPGRAEDLVMREAVLPRGLGALGCLAVGLGMMGFAGFGVLRGAIAVPVMFGFGGLCVFLMGLAFKGAWQAAKRPSNWRLRATPDGLYVKVRSFLSHRLPAEDRIVVFIPRRGVGWLRRHDQRMVRGARDGDNATTISRGCLEIQVDGSLDELDRAIAEERQRWIPTRMGRKRYGHYAVSVQPGGIVRVDWHGPHGSLRPKLDAALALLMGRFGYRKARPATTARGSVTERPGPEHEEQMREHALRGETIEAIQMARTLYGCDLGEAKRFVEELKTQSGARAKA